MQKVLFPALLALALFVSACSRSSTSSSTPVDSKPPPPWTLKDLDGKTVSLSDFKGKVVVLDFWATWCPPCLIEIPHLIELQNKYKNRGVTVVGISLDSLEPADVAKFAKDNGMNYPIVMADEKTATIYGADQAIPLTIVVDARGNVVGRHIGITDKATFEGDINKALSD